MSDQSTMPATWRLTPDRGLRRIKAGSALIGGTPTGVLRLSDAGASITNALLSGEEIGSDPSRTSLAQRLVDRGMAHPVPTSAGPPATDVTVVIPVKNDATGLAHTLAALPPVGRIIVVDDGSTVAVSGTIDHASPITVRRNSTSVGPGPARNVALGEATTPLLLFLDAGVELGEGALATLLSHLDDDHVVAAGPRVTVRPPDGHPTAIDRYEADHSPLDLGPAPSPVRPDAAVTYLPTACLLVRRQALREVGPFDPALRYGEDVDLLWRLRAIGSIRYVPTAQASHPPRRHVRSFVRQRVGYGSAAGPLGRRHGAAVAPLRSSGWTLAILGLAVARRPFAALALQGLATKLLAPKLGSLDDPTIEAARLTATGTWWAGRTAARSAIRTWWPLTALGLAVPLTRPATLRWLSWSLAERLATDKPKRPDQFGLGVLDDLSYGAGVWLGAWRERSVVAIAPALSNQSTSGRLMIKSSNWTTLRESTLRKRISSFRFS